MHGWLNENLRRRSGRVFALVQNGAADTDFQSQLNTIFWNVFSIWLVLIVIVFFRLGDQITHYFFPFLGWKANPWERGQVGGGISALLSFASYIQIFMAAFFGVAAALAQNSTVRMLAIMVCCLAWPGYIFDRTRNTMLMVVVPGILSFVFIRIRSGWLSKIALLFIFFAATSFWLAFILANRTNYQIVSAVQGGEGVGLLEAGKETHHEGLNMFEELCWVNKFIFTGEYQINWGHRYYTELVNPIPRGIWAGKPAIGADYAVARARLIPLQLPIVRAEVTATVSTGIMARAL